MERVQLAVKDRWQRPAVVEVLVGGGRVAFRYAGADVGVAVREVIRGWLTCPAGPFVLDRMTLSEVGRLGIAIAVDAPLTEAEVPSYVLPDHALTELRAVI